MIKLLFAIAYSWGKLCQPSICLIILLCTFPLAANWGAHSVIANESQFAIAMQLQPLDMWLGCNGVCLSCPDVHNFCQLYESLAFCGCCCFFSFLIPESNFHAFCSQLLANCLLFCCQFSQTTNKQQQQQ